MIKRLDEILSEINSAPNVKDAIITECGVTPYLRDYLIEAFDHLKWIDVDVADLKYDKSVGHWSLAPSRLLSRYSVTCINELFHHPDMSKKQKQRKMQFFMEYLCAEEAEVMKLIISKNITSAYPNITIEIVSELFPKELTVVI